VDIGQARTGSHVNIFYIQPKRSVCT
jgi:hypothetical protein